MANLSKSNVPQFSVDVYQNEYLPEGGREVNAIVTVTSTGGGTPAAAAAGADSTRRRARRGRGHHGRLLRARWTTRRRRCATRGTRRPPPSTRMRDGVAFAVVAGTHEATRGLPGQRPARGRRPATRAEAKQRAAQAERRRRHRDRHLAAARRPAAVASSRVGIRHAILLTDGRNEHETPEHLRATLDACAGRFTCDCRGVGTDWEVDELRQDRLGAAGHGRHRRRPGRAGRRLPGDDGDRDGQGGRRRGAAAVDPGRAPRSGSSSRSRPTVEDLTGRRTEAGPRAGDYPIGSWGAESRDYHVCVEVPPGAVGEEMLAARVSLVLPQPDGTGARPGAGAGGVDRRHGASTRINPQVAHYTGQAELAEAIQEGLEARKAGDIDGATAKLGRAVQLASASGNKDTAKLLAKVVDVVDAATGTVRLKARVAERTR